MIRNALLAIVLIASPLLAADPQFTRAERVVYGEKDGMALTMDVFQPKEHANGKGIILAVSGGWFSDRSMIDWLLPREFISRGYTVFAVCHGRQPKFTIPEVLQDLNRAVRFIRAHAADYKVDAGKLGIYGGSAGGHLSLMQGTTGADGDPRAKDPIDRLSSRVQCVACFFPPTDFLNYGKEGQSGLGEGLLANFAAAFDFQEMSPQTHRFERITDPARRTEIGKAISPIYHVSKDTPPTCIFHGDADPLVPYQQAQVMIAKLKEAGVPCKLVTKPGAGHGWDKWTEDLKELADWFDEHLK